MTPKLEKIWIGQRPMDDEFELRLDWSNDYHHAFTIRRPCGPEQVANALRNAAIYISRDVVLNKNSPDPFAKAGRKE